MIVLDTDVCVFLLRGNERVIARRAAAKAPVMTTAITASELSYGAEKSEDPAGNHLLVTELLKSLPILALTAGAALHFGSIKARLERDGQRLDDADLWIASIALQHGAMLATGNIRHFQRITELPIDNWLKDKP